MHYLGDSGNHSIARVMKAMPSLI